MIFKQFFIRKGEYSGDTWGDSPFYSVVSETSEDITNPIHVIEYSAYENMQKQIDSLNLTNEALCTKLETVMKQNEIMREALGTILINAEINGQVGTAAHARRSLAKILKDEHE